MPLAKHFLLRWSSDLGRHISGWSDDVEAYLKRHSWPGNVRELENTIERGVVLARSDRLELDDLLIDPEADAPAPEDERPSESLQAFLEGAAADRIKSGLRHCGGVKIEAARKLGIDRTTLYRLMRKYAIENDD